MDKLSTVGIGDQVYLTEGGEEFGAVREVERATNEIVIYVENAGDFTVSAEAIHSAHDGKVILDRSRLDERLSRAIARAHEREEPGL